MLLFLFQQADELLAAIKRPVKIRPDHIVPVFGGHVLDRLAFDRYPCVADENRGQSQ
jgi:hypothetical protein